MGNLDDFVERVSERTDICSVISRYVPLTQKGGRWWACCPFHNEKTPSLCVTPERGFFYCFGCGTGGNAFKFISLIENINYFEAIKLQAERLGIDLPARKYSPEEERRQREQKTLLDINRTAQDFYHECLIKTARGEIGRKYFAGRGITPETIATFKLGYAPDEWESLLPQLTRQNFLPKQIEEAGLIAKRKNSAGYYDRFRGRVMIPIADVSGHVVGFGGRILVDADDAPKYLNTPETAVFNKRNLLFGLDKSKRAIMSAGFAIVVEGYMDAISLYSAGIQNVVATLGTAFTPEHARLIARYARKIIFCYDSDEAGQRATIRALPIVQAAGIEVFVVKVPDGKDPDDFVRKHGKKAFDALVAHAQSLIDYRLKYVTAHSDLKTIDGKKQALQEILPVVANVDSVLQRNEYRKRIAAELLLDEGIIADEWRNFLRNRKADEPSKNSVAVKRPISRPKKISAISEACDTLLFLAWSENDIIDYISTAVPPEFFSQPQSEILTWLRECASNDIRPDEIGATEHLSEETLNYLSRILTGNFCESTGARVTLFEDSMNTVRQAALKKKYDSLLVEAEGYISSDRDAYVKSVGELLKVKREMDTLKGD